MNREQLKWAMTLWMVLDHIGYFIPGTWAIAFHIVTRCVAPIFAYFIVEGYRYTSNRRRYALRLWGFGIAMSLGNLLSSYLLAIPVHNNIFLTLACGFSIIWAWDTLKNEQNPLHRVLARLLFALCIYLGLLSEGGFVLVPFMLITHLNFDNKKRQYIGYALLSLAHLLLTVVGADDLVTTIMLNPDWLFITCIPLLLLYNGKKGNAPSWSKWAFYVFYPLHLWIIAIVASLSLR